MDSKKILAIVAVAIIAVGTVVAVVMLTNNEKGDLSVAYLQKNGYETQMVAQSKGYFGDYGLNVTGVTVTGSGQDAVNKLLAGEVDIAATGQGPVANTFHNYSDDLVVLCGVNHSTGGQVWVTTNPNLVAYNKATDNQAEVLASFATESDNGANPIKFGCQQDATTASEFKGWLKAMGIKFVDFDNDPTGEEYVQLVHYKANTLVATLAAGTIDGMAASQPFPAKALSTVANARQIGTNADVDSYDLSMYITTKKVYDEKKDLLEKFLKALNKASKFMADEKNLEECITICNAEINNEDAVKEAFKIAVWKTAWSDDMANTLFKTCEKKKYTEITLQMCKDKCPFTDVLSKF